MHTKRSFEVPPLDFSFQLNLAFEQKYSGCMIDLKYLLKPRLKKERENRIRRAKCSQDLSTATLAPSNKSKLHFFAREYS